MEKGFYLIIGLIVVMYVFFWYKKLTLFIYYKNYRQCRKCGAMHKKIPVPFHTKTQWRVLNDGRKDKCDCDYFLF